MQYKPIVGKPSLTQQWLQFDIATKLSNQCTTMLIIVLHP